MGNPVSAPQMLRKDLRGEFIEAEMVERAPFLYEQICSEVQTTSDRENFAYLDAPASMEEFVDEVPDNSITDMGDDVPSGQKSPGYEVPVKTWVGGLTFKRDDWEDEKVGGLRQRVQDQNAAANGFPDERLYTVLTAGTATACHRRIADGSFEYFFTATHEARGSSGAWSNLLTGAGTSVANLQTDINAALKAMYTYKNEAGRLINQYIRRFFILYPFALDATMRTAVQAAIISQTSNVGFAGEIVLFPWGLLDGDSTVDYYVGAMPDQGLAGLIYLNRQEVQIEEIGVGSEMWVNERQMKMAVNRRCEIAYGRPERLVKVNNT